jgi:hypothetical protein
MEQMDPVFQGLSFQSNSSKRSAGGCDLLLLSSPSDYASVAMNNMIRKVRDDTDADCRPDDMSRTSAKLSDQSHRDVDPLLTAFWRSLLSLKWTEAL